MRGNASLKGAAEAMEAWPTPDAQVINDSEEPETFLARQQREKAKGQNGNGMGLPLTMAAKMWLTPNVGDVQVGPPNTQNQAMLANQARVWPTPSARDWKGANDELHDRGAKGAPLNEIAKVWSTPRSHEAGQYQYSNGDPTKPVATLTGQAFSLPDREISTVGETSSHIRRTLNPLFVEWLMGWPPGWTSLGLTPPASSVFACSETALSAYRQHMRSALSQLGSPPEAPAQLGLSL